MTRGRVTVIRDGAAERCALSAPAKRIPAAYHRLTGAAAAKPTSPLGNHPELHADRTRE